MGEDDYANEGDLLIMTTLGYEFPLAYENRARARNTLIGACLALKKTTTCRGEVGGRAYFYALKSHPPTSPVNATTNEQSMSHP